MSIDFRFAQLGEYAACSRFLNDHWAEDHIYCRSEPLFEWTFRRPGYTTDGEYTMAVGEENGELVGILGGIPFTFNVFGASAPGIWMANYVIRPDYRRGPTALRLLSMLRGDPYAATVAFGINPATGKIYQVLRGKVLPRIPRHFAVLPGCEDRLFELIRTAYPEQPEERSLELSRGVTWGGAQDPARDFSTELPASWDEVDWPVLAKATVGAARDKSFLQWRYESHPLFDYRFLAVPEGERTGLLAWRLETIHRRAEDGSREPIEKIARLLELLPTSEANARELLARFRSLCAAEGALGADYYGFHGAQREMLDRLGFRSLSDENADAIPSRFQPLDGKGGGILSAFFLKHDAPAVAVDADCPWYWTKADSDQDRPN